MPGKKLFLIGVIGFAVSLIGLLVCLLIPIVNGPRASWGEAMIGIIPSAIFTVLFLVLTFVGMFVTMNAKEERRRDDFDDDDDRPRRRSRRDDGDDDHFRRDRTT